MGNLDRKTGWYLPEVAHPYHVFQQAGFEQHIVSPKGGKAPMASTINSLIVAYINLFSVHPDGMQSCQLSRILRETYAF